VHQLSLGLPYSRVDHILFVLRTLSCGTLGLVDHLFTGDAMMNLVMLLEMGSNGWWELVNLGLALDPHQS
jgi:hypothetical protein